MADLRDEHGNPVQLADQYGKPVQLTDEYGNPMHITGVATSQTAGDNLAREKHELKDQLHHDPINTGGVAAAHAPPLHHPGGVAATHAPPVQEQHHHPGGVAAVGGLLAREKHELKDQLHHDPMHTGGVAATQAPPMREQIHQSGGVAAAQAPPVQKQLHHPGGVAAVGGGGLKAYEPPPLKEQIQPVRHEPQDQLRRSSSSSSEEDEHGVRRKKGLREKIKETFGGGKHKEKDEIAHGIAPTTTHGSAASTTVPAEKKGVLGKIKDKLPGHHHNV